MPVANLGLSGRKNDPAALPATFLARELSTAKVAV
jgi:hypothetical protein